MMSSYDYRSMIFPLLKSFLLAHLEDLFDKDAIAKYDAIIEALVEKIDGMKNFSKVYDIATYCIETFQLHQNDAEKVDTPNFEINVSVSAEDMRESTVIKKKQLEQHLEKQRKLENESAKKRRSQADVEKVVSPNLVAMAVKTASRQVHETLLLYRAMQEVAFVPIPSRKLLVNFFFNEWLNLEDLVESPNAYELKQQLVDEVMKIAEELEAERNRKNEATQEDLSEHNMDK
ncbi:hypothetical protein Patl1_22088 [Pistacia atlantica]|uniref:Uncharacterized protein n=1 Tax=Pistacia atlantica TaxID=434234 RepID=A0ACC1BL36_9ROSI|nr:hypothetical protein Patl1_22088 [Pistacia atlantica]